MKKNYFMLAAAALMFAACAETDFVNPVPVNEGEVIGFETFANNSTRALNGTNLEDYTTTFGVWAYKTPTGGGGEVTVMDNYQVVNTTGTSNWSYAGQGPSSDQVLKYWDKLASYEFFAYAPYQASGVTIASDVISIADGEYAANENLQTTWGTSLNNTANFSGTGAATDKSTDWMVATKIERAAAANDIVNETFYHTMSKLVVILKSTVKNTDVTSVSVGNVYGTGKCEVSATTSAVTATWTPTGAVKFIPGVTGAITDIDEGYYSMEYLLIPSATVPTFSINYTINGEPYVVTNTAISAITSFEENTIYTLTVTIGPNPIVFDATAEAYSTPLTPGVDIH
ncbi:MAG: fimbrillin family protein [Bacteroidales bacterium]|nr:fimbrillin family protein [Bacteroidales bacterium]